MTRANLVIGSLLFVTALLMFSVSLSFPKPQVSGLSPSVFPRFVAVCTMICSGLLIIKNLRKREQAEKAAAEFDISFTGRFVGFTAIGFVYVLVIDTIGFILATPLLIAGSMLLFREKRWLRIVLVPVFTTAVLYMLFRMVFRVPLPRIPFW